MTFFKSDGDRVPNAIEAMAKEVRTGRMDRLALASAFGASTALAYGTIGLAAPDRALAEEPKKGGTLRISMSTPSGAR